MLIYWSSSRAGKLAIVENGECRCGVILPDNLSEHIRRAANEFCLHVGKVANIEVPVFKASQVRNVPEGFK